MAWWPFKRRAKPTPPETPQSPAAGGDSAEDWAAGDLAECVVHANGQWYSREPWGSRVHNGPGNGDINRVLAVCIMRGRQALVFNRYGYYAKFDASFFRKITPKADAIECADADFIQSIKPKVVT